MFRSTTTRKLGFSLMDLSPQVKIHEEISTISSRQTLQSNSMLLYSPYCCQMLWNVKKYVLRLYRWHRSGNIEENQHFCLKVEKEKCQSQCWINKKIRLLCSEWSMEDTWNKFSVKIQLSESHQVGKTYTVLSYEQVNLVKKFVIRWFLY